MSDMYADLFGVVEETKKDDKYSTKVGVPQYLPKNEKPSVFSLWNDKKYQELMTRINTSNVSENDKEFLRFAATRHIVFNYSLIADYYAHSSKEMQELMEESALVIIDLDDAIANGYVKLSKNIKEIMERTGIACGENHNQFANKK